MPPTNEIINGMEQVITTDLLLFFLSDHLVGGCTDRFVGGLPTISLEVVPTDWSELLRSA